MTKTEEKMEPLTITTEYNKGFKFERPIGKYGVKEFAYAISALGS